VAATAATRTTAVVAAAVDGGSGCGGDDDDEDDGSAAAAAAVWSTVACEREGKWSSRLRGQGRKWVLPERRRRRRRKSEVLPVERRQRQKGRPRATGRMPVEPRVGIGLSLPTFLARHFAPRE